MKKKNIAVLIFVFASSGFVNVAFAGKMNCEKFIKEKKQISQSLLENQKQSDAIEKQLQSGAQAMDDYTKNCQPESAKANCNPASFEMIRHQMMMLSGQKQKLQNEMMATKVQLDESTETLRQCQSVKLQKIRH